MSKEFIIRVFLFDFYISDYWVYRGNYYLAD